MLHLSALNARGINFQKSRSTFKTQFCCPALPHAVFYLSKAFTVFNGVQILSLNKCGIVFFLSDWKFFVPADEYLKHVYCAWKQNSHTSISIHSMQEGHMIVNNGIPSHCYAHFSTSQSNWVNWVILLQNICNYTNGMEICTSENTFIIHFR